MSAIAIGPQESQGSAFTRATMLVIVGIGTLAFLAMLVLGAYAPDLRSGRNGGSHALSNSVTGFSGVVRLAQATGRNPMIVRAANELESEDLAVVTPDDGWTDLSEILQWRGARVTLLVLPKWETVGDPRRSGWVRVSGLRPVADPEAILAPALTLSVTRIKSSGGWLATVHPAAPPELRFQAPEITQVLSGDKIEPIITDSKGRIVLGKLPDRPLYLLAEPDLLNNHGISDAGQAKAALELLDFLNSTDATGIMFDVTANGLGRSRSPLKLMFDPPFLAVTLTIFTAMLLAALQALVRFGAARRPERAIAFGKAALLDNSAALIRKAGREPRLARRYVDVIRERAAAMFSLPATLSNEALDARLDAINSGRSFTKLAAAAGQSRTREDLLGTAQSLHNWLEEVQA